LAEAGSVGKYNKNKNSSRLFVFDKKFRLSVFFICS